MTTTPNKPEPNAHDELRAAFEKAMNDARFFPAELCFAQTKSPSGRDEYANSHLQSNWYGWQAGAQWQASRISPDAADLISRLRASIAGKESFEEVKVFVANIRAAIQCLERGVAPEGWWAALNTLRDNLETFGPYGQETARVAIECCMDALEELDGAAPSAPQAVAAPSAHTINGLTYEQIFQRGRLKAIDDYKDMLAATAEGSQQPVPALTASIDTHEFHDLLMSIVYSSGNGFDCSDEFNAVIAHVEVWAAQLVQQRATLSDDQILDIMSKHWEHQWGGCESRYIRFRYADMVPAVRALLAASEAK